jgi:hypothetical protein
MFDAKRVIDQLIGSGTAGAFAGGLAGVKCSMNVYSHI